MATLGVPENGRAPQATPRQQVVEDPSVNPFVTPVVVYGRSTGPAALDLPMMVGERASLRCRGSPGPFVFAHHQPRFRAKPEELQQYVRRINHAYWGAMPFWNKPKCATRCTRSALFVALLVSMAMIFTGTALGISTTENDRGGLVLMCTGLGVLLVSMVIALIYMCCAAKWVVVKPCKAVHDECARLNEELCDEQLSFQFLKRGGLEPALETRLTMWSVNFSEFFLHVEQQQPSSRHGSNEGLHPAVATRAMAPAYDFQATVDVSGIQMPPGHPYFNPQPRGDDGQLPL